MVISIHTERSSNFLMRSEIHFKVILIEPGVSVGYCIKYGVNEELSDRDEDKIRKLIRQEVSAIFFDLFKKRKNWGA